LYQNWFRLQNENFYIKDSLSFCSWITRPPTRLVWKCPPTKSEICEETCVENAGALRSLNCDKRSILSAGVVLDSQQGQATLPANNHSFSLMLSQTSYL